MHPLTSQGSSRLVHDRYMQSGSGPDHTTLHFLIKTTLISFLAYYTECSITKLFLYSRSLHYYFLYPFYISLTFTVVELRMSTDCFVNKTNISSMGALDFVLWRTPSELCCSRVGVGSSPTRRLEPSGSLYLDRFLSALFPE